MKKIILFNSIHSTIKADKLLQNTGYEYQVVTTPKDISSDCTMSIEVAETDLDEIYKYLSSNEIQIKGVYDV